MCKCWVGLEEGKWFSFTFLLEEKLQMLAVFSNLLKLQSCVWSQQLIENGVVWICYSRKRRNAAKQMPRNSSWLCQRSWCPGEWGQMQRVNSKGQTQVRLEELDGQRTIHTRLEAVGTSHTLSIKLPFPFILHRGCEDSERKMQAEIDKAESSCTMPVCSHYVHGSFKFMLLLSTY